MNIALLSYNNYYNRIVKRHETVVDYINNGAISCGSVNNVNFNPNDGVTSSQIINNTYNNSGIIPDYLLVTAEDNNTIISRWFIIEATRIREGQYKLDLLRDLIADNYDEILSAPMFIEKATLGRNDPRIFNNEAMSFNQIKTSETLLKDKTNVPWIVGYIARNTESTTISVPTASTKIDYELTSLEGYSYHQYTWENPYVMSYDDLTVKMYLRGLGDNLQVGWDSWGYGKMPEMEVSPGQVTFPPGGTYLKREEGKCGFKIKNIELTYGVVLDQVLDHTVGIDWITPSRTVTGVPANPRNLSGEEGKIIKASDRYYKIHYHTRQLPRQLATVNSTISLGIMFQNVAKKCDRLTGEIVNEPVGAVEYVATGCYFTFEEIFPTTINCYIKSDRAKLSDAPYDMFAIPYGSISFSGLESNPITSPWSAMAVAQQMSVVLDKQLYDIQLLPFCPIVTSTGSIDMTGKVEHVDYEWIKTSNNAISSILFWMNSSSFATTIPGEIKVPEDPIEFKVANECDKYRLVSPTYSGEFEFSATKNNGVSEFKAFCTYKPYNPFIKVVPKFKNLYGQEYGDARGCICQGDFSLPQTSDAWTQYQINNKNYLNAFNRQIENMEVNNSIQRTLEKWQVGAGAVQAAGTGAMTGAMMGGGYGAVAGAAIGGGFSVGGGIKDIQLAERLRQEALDYTKDQFGYQLGNIQALPYSLANIGALTIISKYFPILEYYTCTEIEKEALRNKIKYNGMTVGTVGTIQDFKLSNEKSYIKGKLIRLENSEEDYHYVNAIANELSKGVFI